MYLATVIEEKSLFPVLTYASGSAEKDKNLPHYLMPACNTLTRKITIDKLWKGNIESPSVIIPPEPCNYVSKIINDRERVFVSSPTGPDLDIGNTYLIFGESENQHENIDAINYGVCSGSTEISSEENPHSYYPSYVDMLNSYFKLAKSARKYVRQGIKATVTKIRRLDGSPRFK